MAHYSRIPEISLDGYQVVKGEMFIHFPRKSEAACTLWPTSISFNKMALQTLNNCERIRIEINAQKDFKSHEVPDPVYAGSSSLEINSLRLCSLVAKLHGGTEEGHTESQANTVQNTMS